jgi:hypothetical protein
MDPNNHGARLTAKGVDSINIDVETVTPFCMGQHFHIK